MTHEAIRALARREDAVALPTLASTAAVDDQFVRRTAIEVIGQHPHGRGLQAVVLSALDDPSEFMVQAACDVIAGWHLSTGHDLVMRLLKDASPATRQAALRAVDAIWVDTDYPLIFGLYSQDPIVDVRRDAAWV